MRPHDMALYGVKPFNETRTPWDCARALARLPRALALTSPADTRCALLKS